MKEMEKEIIEVSLDNIIPNRFQPRLAFDEQSLNELSKSIRQHGIIQPLVLRKVENKYEIIAGERRYKAAYIAGLTKVPAVIIDLDDNESAEVAIVENLQRQDLSPIEEARSYKKLLDRGYLTQEQLAARMGKTQATISNKLRLLNLEEEVQDALLNGKISERHARSLLRLDSNDQKEVLKEIINQRLSVKNTEDLINQKLKGNIQVNDVKSVENYDNNFENLMPNLNNLTQEKSNNFINPELIREEINTPTSLEAKPSIDKNPIPFIRPILDDNELNKKSEPVSIVQNDYKNITMVENKINETISNIKNLGFNVKLEQYDFDSLYQFVIKVDKK